MVRSSKFCPISVKFSNLFRNANKRDILKAYRKKAQEWHPDNFSDENQKKIAEKKFVDIAAAKEVCSFDSFRT